MIYPTDFEHAVKLRNTRSVLTQEGYSTEFNIVYVLMCRMENTAVIDHNKHFYSQYMKLLPSKPLYSHITKLCQF